MKALIAAGHQVLLWVPRNARLPEWTSEVSIQMLASKGQVFEQVHLPLRTLGRPLLSMGGPAPAFKRRQVAVLHDATPFRLPETYSRAFASWYRWLYRRIARSKATIATVSTFSARELGEFLHLDVGSIVLAAPAGTSSPGSTVPSDRLPEKFFLTVGTPARHKNLLPVIEAVAGQGMNVVCVGLSGSSQVFASSALPHDERVARLGRVSDEELQWLYRNAQALLFPSLYEGFGLPALEAQLAGCPVIASQAGPMPEVLGDSALLVDPQRPELFAAAARSLLEEPALREDLRQKGLVNAARFAWSRTATILASAMSARVH
ncbi:glycosyltransferase family 1 protein [Amnibacterium soli]|uniref:glycosyltransferase family 4 protein n=1 Tax=Amnibacterium soli TaxID=1282736 RepID=UPI0031F0253D